MSRNKRNLRMEMSGDDIRQLQRQLLDLGFVIEKPELGQGHFGESTRDAVRDFQKAHELNPTGEADEQTLMSISSALQARPGSGVEHGLNTITYTVKPGDTLSEIAARFGTTVDAIVQLNGIEDPSRIFSNQEFVIPLPSDPGDTPPGTPSYLISGIIRTDMGIGVPEVEVQGFDKKVGKLVLLGETITNDAGFYQIDYSNVASESLKDQSLDIIVKCHRDEWRQYYESDLLINAGTDAHINVTVPASRYRGLSEFDQLEKVISDSVQPEEVPNLEPDDISYLVAKLKLDAAKFNRYIHAWQLETDAREYVAAHEIPVAVFYGIIGDDALPTLSSLVSQNEQNLNSTLRKATTTNIIAAELEDQIKNFVTSLEDLAVEIADREPDDPDVFSIKGLIKSLEDLPTEESRKLIHTYARRARGSDDYVTQIRKDDELKEYAEPVQALFSLAELTHNNLPLIRQLHQDIGSKAIPNVSSLRDLAKCHDRQ